MSRRSDTRGFKGGFIPTELKSADPEGKNSKSATQWQGSSDREESLSDPRWHKRSLTKGKKANTNSSKQTTTEGNTKVQDAREVIIKKKIEETRSKSNFPKIIFSEDQEKRNSPTERKNLTDQLKTTSCQTEERASSSAKTNSCQTEIEVTSRCTQTKLSREQQSEDETWASRVKPNKDYTRGAKTQRNTPTDGIKYITRGQPRNDHGGTDSNDRKGHEHVRERRRHPIVPKETKTGTRCTVLRGGDEKRSKPPPTH